MGILCAALSDVDGALGIGGFVWTFRWLSDSNAEVFSGVTRSCFAAFYDRLYKSLPARSLALP